MPARKQSFVVFIEQTDGYGPLVREVRALDDGEAFDVSVELTGTDPC